MNVSGVEVIRVVVSLMVWAFRRMSANWDSSYADSGL